MLSNNLNNKTALVFGNGTYEKPNFYLKIIKKNPKAYLVAVDGGYDFLIKNGIQPNLLIGDLDSIKTNYSNIKVIQVKPEKDETDTRLALNYLKENGFRKIILLGMFSLDRIDHSLVNILILVNYVKDGIKVQLENYFNRMFFLVGPTEYKLLNKLDKTISLIPLTSKIVDLNISGVKYPLKNKNMNYYEADLTVSNEVTSNVCTISLKDGIILVDLIKHEK